MRRRQHSRRPHLLLTVLLGSLHCCSCLCSALLFWPAKKSHLISFQPWALHCCRKGFWMSPGFSEDLYTLWPGPLGPCLRITILNLPKSMLLFSQDGHVSEHASWGDSGNCTPKSHCSITDSQCSHSVPVCLKQQPNHINKLYILGTVQTSEGKGGSTISIA